VVLMPESAAAGRLDLYRCAADGTIVEHWPVATDIRAADPTLFTWRGTHWIAYTDVDRGLYDNLCLLYARDLRGPWKPHRANPVKIDVTSSRPAGPLFRHGGHWYRPAQDCAAGYGAALTINQVLRVDRNAFEERTVARLEPDPDGPYPHGLHTLSRDGDGFWIDGKRLRVEPRALLRKILRRTLNRRAADSAPHAP